MGRGIRRPGGRLLADRHDVDGRLRRASRDGAAVRAGRVLEDYAACGRGVLRAAPATGEGRWLALAGQLLDIALDRFADGNGGFYDTADDAEQLITRPADPTDNATPSGLSALAAALSAYTALTGETSYRAAALDALKVLPPIAEKYPRAGGMVVEAWTCFARAVYGFVARWLPGLPGGNIGPADQK